VQLLCEGRLVAAIFYEPLYVPQRVVFTGLKATRIMDDQRAVLLVICKRLPDVVAASPFSTATDADLGLYQPSSFLSPARSAADCFTDFYIVEAEHPCQKG
jgi:hypothetical protein